MCTHTELSLHCVNYTSIKKKKVKASKGLYVPHFLWNNTEHEQCSTSCSPSRPPYLPCNKREWAGVCPFPPVSMLLRLIESNPQAYRKGGGMCLVVCSFVCLCVCLLMRVSYACICSCHPTVRQVIAAQPSIVQTNHNLSACLYALHPSDGLSGSSQFLS